MACSLCGMISPSPWTYGHSLYLHEWLCITSQYLSNLLAGWMCCTQIALSILCMREVKRPLIKCRVYTEKPHRIIWMQLRLQNPFDWGWEWSSLGQMLVFDPQLCINHHGGHKVGLFFGQNDWDTFLLKGGNVRRMLLESELSSSSSSRCIILCIW